MPIIPCAEDSDARVIRSGRSGLSSRSAGFSNLSAELSVVRDSRVSGMGSGVTGAVVVDAMGVVDRVSGLGRDG